jgi:polyphosphate kinase 2 (PPK2 family)
MQPKPASAGVNDALPRQKINGNDLAANAKWDDYTKARWGQGPPHA